MSLDTKNSLSVSSRSNVCICVCTHIFQGLINACQYYYFTGFSLFLCQELVVSSSRSEWAAPALLYTQFLSTGWYDPWQVFPNLWKSYEPRIANENSQLLKLQRSLETKNVFNSTGSFYWGVCILFWTLIGNYHKPLGCKTVKSCQL